MIVKPKVRGFICTTAHPKGCEVSVKKQIDYIKQKSVDSTGHHFKNILVIGCSMGYGLASRIALGFGHKAATLGVCFEREPKENKIATAGWYHTIAFHQFAKDDNLYAKTLNGDAFSKEMKSKVISVIKEDLGKIDLMIYSLASPKRKDPISEQVYSSVLKPIKQEFSNKTVNTTTGEVVQMSVSPASEKEIHDTIKVMGGEDWKLWVEMMKAGGVLQEGFKTIAYSYIGPKVTQPIYRNGTIGKAKENLEESVADLNETLSEVKGSAYVSVNKALVTQASSAIPVLPLYIAILFKVMKANNTHEGCIEQMYRLFFEKMHQDTFKVDSDFSLIRLDDFEMQESVQAKVDRLWQEVNSENVMNLTDLEGYRKEFLKLFGFEFSVVNYEAEVSVALFDHENFFSV